MPAPISPPAATTLILVLLVLRVSPAKIRIGKQGTQNGTFIAGIFGVTMTGSPVVLSSTGKLGVSATSSARFKEAVKPHGQGE